MVELKKVTKEFGKNKFAIKNLSLHIRPKEFVSLVGKSGTGKTTLAKLLIAEERPTKGKIIIGGWDISKIKPYEVPQLRRQIGVVFQDFKLLPKKTVYENVAFALEVLGFSYFKIKKIVPRALEMVGLQDKANFYPMYLSGGEKQRVVIARSLVHRPKLLIADEPTGNLDEINTQEIINLLLKINDFGTTVILITHDPTVVNSLNRRVITLDKGLILADEEQGKYDLASRLKTK